MDKSKMKYELLRSITPSKFKHTHTYQVNIAGVKILLHYEGRSSDVVKTFLHDYLDYFPKFNDTCDVEIFYSVPEGEIGDESWEPWNIWPHEIEFVENQFFDYLIERDFVAQISKDGKKIYAHGPIWSLATCDSIDNLLVYATGRHLLKYEGLLLHAACVSDNEYAYVFFGASGAGKSTIAEFLYKNDHLSVMSSDQIILKFLDNKIYAHVSPTTIPEFSLHHPARDKSLKQVKSIVHLVQRNGGFQLGQLAANDWISVFMRELFFRKEFSYSNNLLDLAIKFSKNNLVYKGEMSYSKGVGFWNQFKTSIEK